METIELSAEQIGRIIGGEVVVVEYGCGNTRRLYDMDRRSICGGSGARNWEELLTGEVEELSWARRGFRVVYEEAETGANVEPRTIETAEQILNDDDVSDGYCLAVSRMVEALGYEIEEETTYEVIENESV